jgi:hypothetical protein
MNAPNPTCRTADGIRIDESEEQPSNAAASIRESLDPVPKKMRERELQ